MILRELHTTEIDCWIKEHHYLHSTPAGAVLRLEFLNDQNPRVGGMVWGGPTSLKLESKALAMARKYIRKHLPRVKGLITYASTGEHHEGTVYVADGWFEIQRTKGGGDWESRAGRKNRDMSGKIKFARSP